MKPPSPSPYAKESTSCKDTYKESLPLAGSITHNWKKTASAIRIAIKMTYDNTDAQSQPSHHPTTPAKNRVTDAYKNAFWFGVARWAFSIVVLALCAMQLRDESALTYAPYVAALIYNVACVSS